MASDTTLTVTCPLCDDLISVPVNLSTDTATTWGGKMYVTVIAHANDAMMQAHIRHHEAPSD